MNPFDFFKPDTDSDVALIEVEDAREEIFGCRLAVDEEALAHVVDDFTTLTPEDGVMKVKIEFVLPTPEMVDNQVPGSLATTSEGVLIQLNVSDRLEFSHSALSRINRNLVQLIRLSDSCNMLRGIYGTHVGDALLQRSAPILISEAYAQAKNWCEIHERWPIYSSEE